MLNHVMNSALREIASKCLTSKKDSLHTVDMVETKTVQKVQKTVVLGGIAVFTAVTAALVFLSTTYPELFP